MANFITSSDKFKTTYFFKNMSKMNNSYSCDALISDVNCIIDNIEVLSKDRYTN